MNFFLLLNTKDIFNNMGNQTVDNMEKKKNLHESVGPINCLFTHIVPNKNFNELKT